MDDATGAGGTGASRMTQTSATVDLGEHRIRLSGAGLSWTDGGALAELAVLLHTACAESLKTRCYARLTVILTCHAGHARLVHLIIRQQALASDSELFTLTPCRSHKEGRRWTVGHGLQVCLRPSLDHANIPSCPSSSLLAAQNAPPLFCLDRPR